MKNISSNTPIEGGNSHEGVKSSALVEKNFGGREKIEDTIGGRINEILVRWGIKSPHSGDSK